VVESEESGVEGRKRRVRFELGGNLVSWAVRFLFWGGPPFGLAGLRTFFPHRTVGHLQAWGLLLVATLLRDEAGGESWSNDLMISDQEFRYRKRSRIAVRDLCGQSE
jgi:hypothetical protein